MATVRVSGLDLFDVHTGTKAAPRRSQHHGTYVGPHAVAVQHGGQAVGISDTQGVDRRIIHGDGGHSVNHRLMQCHRSYLFLTPLINLSAITSLSANQSTSDQNRGAVPE